MKISENKGEYFRLLSSVYIYLNPKIRVDIHVRYLVYTYYLYNTHVCMHAQVHVYMYLKGPPHCIFGYLFYGLSIMIARS